MAIGDLIPLSQQGIARELLRFHGDLPGGLEMVDDFAETELFETDVRPEARPKGWRSWLPRRRLTSDDTARGRRRASLLKLIETEHDVLEFGTHYGSEAVGVPFAHLVLLGAFNDTIEGAARRQIQCKLEETLADYVDDLTGVRVLCRNSDELAKGQLTLFFGSGVFVPQAGEEPQGHVLVSADPSAPGTDLPLLCREMGPRPAAFYRGQTGLAFGSNQARVAATVGSLLPFDEEAYFYLRTARDDSATLELARSKDMAAYIYDVRRLPSGEDEAAFVVNCTPRAGGERQRFTLRCKRDNRISRLYRFPPSGNPYLEIAGFLTPSNPETGMRPRWWVDLDQNNRLIGVAGMRRATSVVSERGRLTHYDWNDLRFKPEATRAHRLESVKVDKADCSILRASGDAAFGYLALPESSMPVTFQADWWNVTECYTLDWLDFSGGVENPDYPARGKGLAAATRSRRQRIPGWGHAAGSGWIVRQAGAPGFARAAEFELVPGNELIIGPLVLRVPLQ